MRSLRERIIHTALFEALAIAIVTPTVARLTGTSMADSGLLSVLISVGAVATNYLWTLLFDRLVPTRRRGFRLRLAQAVGLEVAITSYTIPLTLWLTGVSIAAAVALDLAGIAFFLLFGMAYNAAFDAVMLRIKARRAVSSSAGIPS